MKREETVDYFLKVTWQTVANKYNLIASEFGITQALGYMLINIHEDGTAVSQIAALMGVRSTSLSRMLKNMEELGLIYRKTDDSDKRSVKIFLTPFGIEKRHVAVGVVKRFNEYLHQHTTEKERKQLIESLNKINQLTIDYTPSIHDPQTDR